SRDWSADVCASDLPQGLGQLGVGELRPPHLHEALEDEVALHPALGRLEELALELLALPAGLEPRQVALERLAALLEVLDEVLEQGLLAAPDEPGRQLEGGGADELVDQLGAARLVRLPGEAHGERRPQALEDRVPRVHAELRG